MQLSHFLQVQYILILFFLIGVVIVAYKLVAYIKSSKNYKLSSLLDLTSRLKIEIIMFFLLFYSVYSYNNIPVKNERYLFNLVLPTFYFSYIGILYILKKIRDNKDLLILVAFIIFVINISIVLIQMPNKEYDTPQVYNSAINTLNELHLSNCSIISNSWVMLNYLERPSLPFLRIELMNKTIEQGQTIVLFKHVSEPDYAKNEQFINSLPIIYENKDYIIIGLNECPPIITFEDTYLQQVDTVIFNLHGYHINQNSCFILFHNSSFLEKTCNFINLNGFKQDKYRVFQ
jgi:hypothetical protein